MTHDREQVGLSPEGEQRREEILSDLTGRLPGITARRTRRKRVVIGSSAMALLLVVSASVVLILNNPTLTPAPAPVVVEGPIESNTLIDFAIVRTSDSVDPLIYIRTDTEAINAMVISDDELLSELAAMGRPAGLIRMNGEVRLSRNVIDPPASDDPGSF